MLLPYLAIQFILSLHIMYITISRYRSLEHVVPCWGNYPWCSLTCNSRYNQCCSDSLSLALRPLSWPNQLPQCSTLSQCQTNLVTTATGRMLTSPLLLCQLTCSSNKQLYLEERQQAQGHWWILQRCCRRWWNAFRQCGC